MRKIIGKSKFGIIVVLVCSIFLYMGCSNQTNVKELTKIPIDKENIMTIAEDLTSEKFAGRLTGTEGNLLAGDYISKYFEDIGITSPEKIEGYKQWYTQKTRLINSAPKLVILDKDGKQIKNFQYVKDFMVQTSPMQKLKGQAISEVVLIENNESLKQDINDKSILIKYDVFNELINSENFVTKLMTSNLKAIIIAMDTSERGYFGVVPYVLEGGVYTSENVPFVVNVNMGVYEELLEAVNNEQSIKVNADFAIEEVKVPNIVAVIEGTSDEYIVIGAHYDHAGENMNGTYNPGALDNASGTASMMEVARILKSYGIKPKKTIVFIAFNGEEQSAYGSKYYASNPIYPLASTEMINIDTVGSKKGVTLQIEGYEHADTEIVQNFVDVAKELGINYKTGTSNGTDHSSFGEKNVEVVNLVNPDFDSGYHGPSDTIDNIKVENIEEVVELIIRYLDEYAY